MNTVGIQVILEAQTAQASNNINTVRTDVNAMSNAVDQAARNINQDFQTINSSAALAAGSVVTLNDAFRNAAATTTTLNQRLATTTITLNDAIRTANNTTNANRNLANSIAGLNRPAVNANGALTGFTNIIRDAPYGIVGVGNNITQLTDAFAQLQRQTGSVGGALAALFRGLFSAGGIFTVGLSAAISLWTVYAQRQQRAASEAKKAADELKSLSDIMKDGARSLAQYQVSAAAEIATLNQLFNIARSDVRSRQERTSALKELQEATNGYLRNLNLETIQTDAARNALDKYNASLFDNALAKAYQGQIDDIAKSYAIVKERADQGKASIAAFDKNVKDANDRLAQLKKQGNPLGDIVDTERMAAENAAKRAKLVADTNNYIKQQGALYDAIIKKGQQLADIQVRTNPFSKSENKAPGALKGSAKIFNDLLNTMNVIDQEGDELGRTLDQINIEKVEALQLAFRELAKIGFATESEELNYIRDQIELYSTAILGATKVTSTFAKQLAQPVISMTRFNEDVIKSMYGNISPDSNLQIGLTITPTISDETDVALVGSIDEAQRKFNQKLQESKPKMTADIEKFTKDINQIVSESALEGIIGLGEAVGAALSKGGGISDVLQAFVNMIASFGERLGKQLIVQGLAIEAFKTSLSSLQGVAAIAAGAALIAASVAFRSLASQGVNSYATGGIVNSPQLALVGDNPGRKEAIIPSEMWDKIGGNGEFTATTKIKGNDLLVIVQRANREFNRFN